MADPPKKRGRGQPQHEPTDATRLVVHTLHSAGIPHRIICRKIGIDDKTLRKHYRTELDDAHLEIEASMIQAIVKAANAGAWGAAKYWLATHSKDDRWRTPEQHRIAGELGAPPIQMAVAVEDMTDDQIRSRIAELEHRTALADRLERGDVVSEVSRKSNGMEH